MDSVTTGNKRTITLSEEALVEIGCALNGRRAEFEETVELLKSVGQSHEYFSERLMLIEGVIKEFYAARNGA